MKRATPTPNRFITSTPNWQAKGFVLFVSLVFFGSCLDETSLIGVKKEASYKVEFREFYLPATTIQSDSVRTQNQFPNESTGDKERLLLGKTYDPNFGNSTAMLFTKFIPKSSKITGLNQVEVEKLTMKLVLDYYVYGDTSSSNLSFAVHEITDGNFKTSPDYFADTPVSFDPNPITIGSYYYNRDSLLKSRRLNTDANTTNNRVDTLYFDLPVGPGSLAQLLLDTALRRGIYVKVKNSSGEYVDSYSYTKADSVFQLTFKGLVVVPIVSDRIIGIRSSSNYSGLTLYYKGYDDKGVKYGRYNYQIPISSVPSFTKIDIDRSGTQLSTLMTKNTDFNAPDGYCYLQSGTGLFTKLDLTEVNNYFDTIPKIAVNSAELIIPLEPINTKSHLQEPQTLVARMVSSENRLLRIPSSKYELLGYYYHSKFQFGINYDYYIDAVNDNGDTKLGYATDSNGRYYHSYISDFLQSSVNLPTTVKKITALGILPGDAPMGKSFHGISFKKDKVRLKVYYTRVL